MNSGFLSSNLILSIVNAGTTVATVIAVICIALLIAGGIQYYSMVRDGKAGRHKKKKRRSRGQRKGVGQDYFQLDMNRYKAQELVDDPPTKQEADLANWLGAKQSDEPAMAVADDTIPGDSQLVASAPWTANAMSHRNMALPPGMMQVMDRLKSNRRYEFSDAGSRHERLGAPCSGGLFAEIQFGRSEDESVLQGSLNPD